MEIDQQAIDFENLENKKQLLCSSKDFSFNSKQGAKTEAGLNIALFDNKTVEFQVFTRMGDKEFTPYVLTYNFRDILGAKITGSKVNIAIYSKLNQGVMTNKIS